LRFSPAIRLVVAPLVFHKRETNIPLGSGPRLYVFVLKSGLKYHIYTRFHAAIVPNWSLSGGLLWMVYVWVGDAIRSWT